MYRFIIETTKSKLERNRRSDRPPKIIHLPTTVGGNPQGLSIAFRRLGIDSESWTIVQNLFGYRADYVISVGSMGVLRRELLRLFALRYVFLCDFAFFNFGQTLFSPLSLVTTELESPQRRLVRRLGFIYLAILQRLEIALLRLNKVTLAVQYQGSDARQVDFTLDHFEYSIAKSCPQKNPYWHSDRLKRKQIELLAKHCAHVYALNPDLLWVLPKQAKFLPYSHIDLNDWNMQPASPMSSRLRIVHAPSNRCVKGTHVVLNSIELLRVEGLDFDFQLIEGISHDQARSAYEAADIVIDQLFAGWYGGLGLEAMALGKVLVTYIRREDLHFIPIEMSKEIPVVEANEHTLTEVLRTLISTPQDDLISLGTRSRAFAEKFHDQTRVAERVLSELGLLE